MTRIPFGFSSVSDQEGSGYEVEEGQILEVNRRVGDRVEEGECILIVELNKGSMEVLAPCDGVIEKIAYDVGEDWFRDPYKGVVSGDVMAPPFGYIETESSDKLPKVDDITTMESVGISIPEVGTVPSAEEEFKSEAPTTGREEFTECSPTEEPKKVSIPDGVEKKAPSISPEDSDDIPYPASPQLVRVPTLHMRDSMRNQVLEKENEVAPVDLSAKTSIELSETEDADIPDDRRVVQLSSMHKEMARRVDLSAKLVPNPNGDTIDVKAKVILELLECLRKDSYFIVSGYRPRIEHIVSLAVISMLSDWRFEVLNGYWDAEKRCPVALNHVNLGIAVDATNIPADVCGQDRLCIPIVNKAETLSFLDLVDGIEDAIKRAKNRKLTQEDDRELTFTINNTGALGGYSPHPMIPITIGNDGKERPTGAILAIGKIGYDIRHIEQTLPLTLRFDHRIIAGRRAVGEFLGGVKNKLESFKTLTDVLNINT